MGGPPVTGTPVTTPPMAGPVGMTTTGGPPVTGTATTGPVAITGVATLALAVEDATPKPGVVDQPAPF